MKVHHLNCGSMHTPAAALVCHVLLLETDAGLVLVDSGFGLDDIASPAERLGSTRHLLKPTLDADETAVRQVERLGFHRNDVRHIIVTHFDLDHIGGISDFPDAQIHVTAAEALGAMWSPSRREKVRYRSVQWSHRPKIVEHSPDGEAWLGFAAAKPLDAIAPGIVLVSLPGHSRGHAAVAVDTRARWLLPPQRSWRREAAVGLERDGDPDRVRPQAGSSQPRAPGRAPCTSRCQRVDHQRPRPNASPAVRFAVTEPCSSVIDADPYGGAWFRPWC
jgi:glyoxylase-like metal-dependent hydrolase (beta-lactamase superfamily II)